MNTRVIDLRNPEIEYYYSLSPEDAVIAAYAQFEKRDYNTWNYAKYRPMLIVGQLTISCGDYAAFRGLVVYVPIDRT